MSGAEYDAIVIGGGFYGCFLGLHLRSELGQHVAIVEAGPELLSRASYANQARVHNGYHYPRSLLTGYRSRVNFERFLHDFRDSVQGDLESYYAIARSFSNVTARQFQLFCERIGAEAEDATAEVRELFDPALIEHVFRVREAVFDAAKLRERLVSELEDAAVDVYLDTEASRIEPGPGSTLEVALSAKDGSTSAVADRVFNCTYSRMNRLLVDSDIAPIPLKHQLTELALVEVPPALSGRAVTVMCGAFFSALPFPPRGLHTLSHVRYTPHYEWSEGTTEGDHRDPYRLLDTLIKESSSSYVSMLKDACRYLPVLAECRYVDSLWEIKTVLPRNAVDDGRPILIQADHGVPGLTCIMGSKIDNVYDMIDVICGAPARVS